MLITAWQVIIKLLVVKQQNETKRQRKRIKEREGERESERWKETDIEIIGTAAQRSNIMIIKSVSLTLPCDIRASIQVLPRRRSTSK